MRAVTQETVTAGTGITVTPGPGGITISATGGVVGSGVTSVGLSAPGEFLISGSPVTTFGTLAFDWAAATVVAHGGTGMGSFAANSLIQAGLTSTGKFQSIPLAGTSSTFLNGLGAFAIPPVPSGGSGTVTSVALGGPAEFLITGSPVTVSGTLAFDWAAPVAVAHGGTGMGSFAAGSLIIAGLTSTGKFQSVPFSGLSSDVLRGLGGFGPVPPQPIQPGTSSTFLNGAGGFTIPPVPAGGSGTVTSVALTLSSDFVVGGSPVTTAGTITGSFHFQSAGFFFGGPITAPDATPTWRFIANTDLPTAISSKNFTSSTYQNPDIPPQTLTDAATVLWNMNSGSTALLTLGSNRAFGSIANLPVNGTGIVKIIQGGTGLTLTFVTQFKFAGNRTLPTLSSCPGQEDILSVYSDGTNAYASAIVNFK